ncbi:transposase domain-containing protein [Streptomyces sp. NPDC002205]|uniref:transposase domain-containing protein n=1 Tax=Streptomyces sp. NPDC002205 TaxID=3154411 RepID=UPI003332BB53
MVTQEVQRRCSRGAIGRTNGSSSLFRTAWAPCWPSTGSLTPAVPTRCPTPPRSWPRPRRRDPYRAAPQRAGYREARWAHAKGDRHYGPLRDTSPGHGERARDPGLSLSSASPPTLVTLSREITVAAGQFTAGHVGGLTPFLPFELVDAVLEQTRAVQQRLRELPSRVGVYFLVAMCLFPEIGHRLVWNRMASWLGVRPAGAEREGVARSAPQHRVRPDAGLVRGGGRGTRPTTHPRSALRPLLHGLLRRLQLDQGARQRAQPGLAGTVPAQRVSPGRADDAGRDRHSGRDRRDLRTHPGGQTAYSTRLSHHLSPEMLVLWDRGFDGNDFLATRPARNSQSSEAGRGAVQKAEKRAATERRLDRARFQASHHR